MESIKLLDLKPHPNNPRDISQEELANLRDSINGFEKMLKAKPIVIDENRLIIAGNQRYKALIALDYKEIPKDWVKVVDYFTESEKKEFMVRDNVENGHWTFDSFEDDFWKDEDWEDWIGQDIETEPDQVDYSDKNKEIDVDDFDDKMVIKLNYTEDEYHQVKDALLKVAQTPEAAIWGMLKEKGLINE